MIQPINAKWIGSGQQNDKKNTLPPELFRKTFTLETLPNKAELSVSAMGIYEARINGRRVGNDYFTPGYTHYESYVQYQTYEVLPLLKIGENTLDIIVANGWWLGRLGKKNNCYGSCRGVIAELKTDGKIVATDESWQVTADTPERFADFYDGQIIDLTRHSENMWQFAPAALLTENLPSLCPHIGAYVREERRLTPVTQKNNVYDFGQNHAGVLHIAVEAPQGTVITLNHAEILNQEGGLFTKNLRTAKAELTLICGRDGLNEFCPRFTFMGFRYVKLTADKNVKLHTLESIVLSSSCGQIGDFSCSDPLLNRLYQNIQWGQSSNFIDIPTDCPQRDERMGWTGDIAVFAETAAMNRDIGAFMDKWLTDLRLYQRENGSLPVTIPENKTYQPSHFPIPIAIWGDAATMVPWAVYRAYGDLEMLERQYDSMKAYTDAELRVAEKGRHPYIWDNNRYQYGDWCAPGENFLQWRRKGKYTSTAFLLNSVEIVRQAAHDLCRTDDEAHYTELAANIRSAFARYCLSPSGRLNGDFQTNYVLTLYFDLAPKEKRPLLAKRLAELVRRNNHKIATGFAGTPYLLFALADNGYTDDAYKVLLNEDCPGWLFTVKAGATTMWERWDALNADGSIRADSIPNMVSFNHYAYGAVGAFFYRRILGIETLEPGYRQFQIRPFLGGGLTCAEGRIGDIAAAWKIKDGKFVLDVTVPENKTARIILPSGAVHLVRSGKYQYSEKLENNRLN
ncbi:MAG: glycoside hydrolase family 78 protein [Eubacterium sp.]|nr:glycoside hydrolase family 78 protein [Eubacterium sp.]